jgi:hypothetical protein
MKAAALGHQYLALKSFHTNDSYLGGARFRGSKVEQRALLESEQNDEQRRATEPISRRVSTVAGQTESSVPTLERSASDSTSSYVVYKPQKGHKPLAEGI